MKKVCEEEDNEGISAVQFGFCKGLSEGRRRVSEALHELPSPGGFYAIIALNVKNTFNSASWKCIYQSLGKEKKMTQYLLKIMDSYLKDRKITIVTEKDNSYRPIGGSTARINTEPFSVDLHV